MGTTNKKKIKTLSSKQMKLAAVANPKNKITNADFKKLRNRTA